MMVSSPGLDELTTLLARRRNEEDAIIAELECQRAKAADDIAVLEAAIRLLEAEHAVSPSPADALETLQEPAGNEQPPVVVQWSRTRRQPLTMPWCPQRRHRSRQRSPGHQRAHGAAGA
jgi:hypothetical protein